MNNNLHLSHSSLVEGRGSGSESPTGLGSVVMVMDDESFFTGTGIDVCVDTLLSFFSECTEKSIKYF